MVKGRPDRGVLVGEVLQLDNDYRKPVDEENDVRPSLLHAHYRVLVYGEEFVVQWIFEIEKPDLTPSSLSVLSKIFDIHAISQIFVKALVVLDDIRTLLCNNLSHGFIYAVQGYVGIDSS